MGYLFIQTFIWILLAFLLGLVLGWLLRGVICGPCNKDEEASSVGSGNSNDSQSADYVAVSTGAASEVASEVSSAEPPPTKVAPAKVTKETKVTSSAGDEVIVTDNMKPQILSGPNGGVADDLKRIRGVGPVIEKTLNGLGVYHFSQIGNFSEDNIKWVDNFLSFRGRIKREEWVSQANDLAKEA